VEGVCDILGFDPLHIANEGKVVAVVGKDDADAVLSIMKDDPMGTDAKIIGEVIAEDNGMVVLETSFGTERIVMPPSGEILPRIC
jgi:hydrogenase expression/formation protein HypE